MLVDANLLLYAVDSTSRWHLPAAAWLSETLNGPGRVGLPWQTLGAFARISTHPRAAARPLTPAEAARYLESWLARPTVWVPPATERTTSILCRLLEEAGASGNLVADAQLASLALEHGLTVYSADSDFARFTQVRWVNPLHRAQPGDLVPGPT